MDCKLENPMITCAEDNAIIKNPVRKVSENDFRLSNIKNIRQEFFKRFYKPIYFPLITLICCLLIFKSKESLGYNKFKIFWSPCCQIFDFLGHFIKWIRHIFLI